MLSNLFVPGAGDALYIAKVVALLTPNAVAKRTLITSQGCDTLTAIVLAEWFYCDHQSALAEYNALYSSLGFIARRSQCLFYIASRGKMEITAAGLHAI